jgi:hypothetical protein
MKLVDYTNPSSFSSRLRKKRMFFFVNFIRQIQKKLQGNIITVLDLGGTSTYWKNFPFDDFKDINFHITLLNLEYPDYDSNELASNVTLYRETGNACDLAYRNRSFDIVHSNSVIEHVGSWANIKAMANEIQRVGNNYFIQTPNFWFPIEPHFIFPLYQFFPRPIRSFILMKINHHFSFEKSILEDERIRLLTKKEIKFLFSVANIKTEYFLVLAKSFIAHSAT